ncbi:MAG TPA: NAD(P)-binding protein, partial [Caulobacteraceae bacterium]|nr:NAD(P)-binding protein [Caulobacteraceae bacterium]
MQTSGAKQKIAILGGGIAALAAAFELTEAEDWRDRYEITVYQMGWRLGGKCATGRGPNGRIEEHGIHAFSGSYYNALGLMWRCYQALGKLKEPGVLESFRDAFRPSNTVVMWELIRTRLNSWPFYLAPNKMSPVHYERSLADIEEIIQSAMKLFERRYRALEARHARRTAGHRPPPENFGDYVRRKLTEIGDVFRFIELLNRTGMTGSLWRTLWTWVFTRPPGARIFGKTRRMKILFNYVATLSRGVFDLNKNILERGLDAIDDQNFDAWLEQYGALPETMASPLVFNTVDLSYNYPFGDTSDAPRMAAGTYLRWTLRMYLNMGNFAWSFEAGTGETVIAPLYHVLKHRGVRFEFFHKVRELKPSGDGKRIERVLIDVQATPKEAEYDPLVWVKSLRCWPNKPKYDLLKEGVELKANEADLESYWSRCEPVGEKVLQAGQDFDKLVFGISIGAVQYLCDDLKKVDPRWDTMDRNIPTCATQTMQIWFDKTTGSIGGHRLTKNLAPQ